MRLHEVARHPDQMLGRIGHRDHRVCDQHIGRHEHAKYPGVFRKPVVGEIEMPRPRHRLPAKLTSGQIEVRLVGPILPRIGGVVLAVVVDAHHQHQHVRLDARPKLLEQQVFLISAVGRHARIDDAVLGHFRAQQFGEALILFGIVAPHEQVAGEGDGRLGRRVVLDVAQAEAVVTHIDGADASERDIRVRDRIPAKLGIVVVDAVRTDAMCAQIAQIDSAQHDFGDHERRDHDRELYQHGAPYAVLRAAQSFAADVTARSIPFSARNCFIRSATNALPLGVQ